MDSPKQRIESLQWLKLNLLKHCKLSILCFGESMTPKQAVALCAALFVSVGGTSSCVDADTASLLQTQNRHRKHLPSPKGLQLLETAHTIIQKINAGDDPNDCSAATGTAQQLVDAGLPAIIEQHAHNVNQLNAAAQAVDDCAPAGGDLSQQGIDLETLRANHQACRTEEYNAELGMEVCEQYEAFRNQWNNRCFPFPDDEGTFPNSMEEAENELHSAVAEAKELRNACSTARQRLSSQQAACVLAQRTFEGDYCEYRSNCAGVQACRIDTEEAYTHTENEVLSAMETVQAEYLVFKHAECLLGHAGDALEQSTIVSGEEVSACSDPADLSPLTIEAHGEFEALTTCDSTIILRPPCKNDFFEAEYRTLHQREAIEAACNACPALEHDLGPNRGSPPWSLVMKSNGNTVLGFESSYWTSSALLNQDSPAADSGNAKYDAFNTAAVSQIKICIGDPSSNCMEHSLPSRHVSALSLFSSGYIPDDSFDRDSLLGILGAEPGSYRDCEMQRPGFNIICRDGNRARFGYCNNIREQPCSTNGGDADATFGFGLSGQSSPDVGAGWTFYAVEPRAPGLRNMWLYVADQQ